MGLYCDHCKRRDDDPDGIRVSKCQIILESLHECRPVYAGCPDIDLCDTCQDELANSIAKKSEHHGVNIELA